MWEFKEPIGGIYDWAEFTLVNGVTNYDVASNISTLFSNVKSARKMTIETDADLYARFNSTLFPAVKIESAMSPFELSGLIAVKNVFLTNSSGDTATVRIWLV